MKWKDVTSYRRGEREQHLPPRSWELVGCSLRVTVHHAYGMGDAWFVSVPLLDIRNQPLKSAVVDAAKHEAFAYVAFTLSKMVAELEKAGAAQ